MKSAQLGGISKGMKDLLVARYCDLLMALSLPIIFRDYFSAESSGGLPFVYNMWRNCRRVPGASGWIEHLSMVTELLKVPRATEGCVVECGCYKGRSTVNLSLVCGRVGRKLLVFDSFCGLPQPSATDAMHHLVDARETHSYTQGAWAGSLDEVKANVGRFGDISVCEFHPGYFERTLPSFSRPVILAFIDADLRSSVETCLKHLWPLLQPGCCLFVHEAKHQEIASLFFDNCWWRKTLNCDAPGLIGAGCGLGLDPVPGGFKSSIGYTVKVPEARGSTLVPQLGT